MKYFKIYKNLLIVLILSLSYPLSSQDYNVRVGVTHSLFRGKAEKDEAGKDLEAYSNGNSFNIGLVREFFLTDESGFRLEMIFTQKRFGRTFIGPTYRIFDSETNNRIYANGQLTKDITITNGYFEVPFSFFLKFENNFEIAAGFSPVMMVSSKGKGTATFIGTTEAGTPIPSHNIELKYDYFKNTVNTIEKSNIFFTQNNEKYFLPRSAGAYIDTRLKKGGTYNVFDVGIHADLAYWINDVIAFRLRANYNFLDASRKNGNPQSKSLDTNREPISRKVYENFAYFQFSTDVKF
jgi:hypothetical protein